MVLSMLLAENREVYMPAVDDHGVDLIVRTLAYNPGAASTDPSHYEFQEIQVKSLSTGGLFAAIKCVPRPNYWFVFYIKNIDKMWLINSVDLVNSKRLHPELKPGDPNYLATSQNNNPQKSPKNFGLWSFDLTPTKRTPVKSEAYVITDFSKLP